jgi:hypothetical protein
MMRKDRLNSLLVLLACLCMLAAGPVNAGYFGFTAASLQTETEDSGGC